MEKKSKKSIIIGITALLLVTLTLLGLTYAYYRTRIVGNEAEKSISVTSKLLQVTYHDGNATFSTGSEDVKIEPGFTFTKEFTITNDGDESVNYAVVLDNVENTFTRTSDWTYELVNETLDDTVEGTITSDEIQYLSTKIPIESKAEHSYKLTVTYENLEDENQSDDMGKLMSFRVNIVDNEDVDSSVTINSVWVAAQEGTLLYALRESNEVVEPLTVPGQAPSGENEALLAATEDDYGTSYYFRGAVENNYVNYSGMCWRIVRVQGDGTIKLALADENGECDADTYSVDNTTSAFVDGRTDITYNSNNSTADYQTGNIPSTLSTWMTKNNIDTSKLTTAEWCNDMSIASQGDGSEYYGAHSRLWNNNGNPTLKCDTVGEENTSAIKFTSEVGILTADEVVFAGSVHSGNAYNYYLMTNASGNSYWTLSPDETGGLDYIGYIWYVHTGGTLGVEASNMYSAVRPAIVLASNITIADGGTGTQTNPYVII